MILASSLMGISEDEFVKTFEIVIQLGAILAVLAIYYKRFLVSIDIYLKLAVAFLPTGIMGLLAYKMIKAYLFNPSNGERFLNYWRCCADTPRQMVGREKITLRKY
jgi:undecaprenyl-diphosphatase